MPAPAIPAGWSGYTIATANRSSIAGSPVSLHVTASGPDKNAGFAPTLHASGLPPGLTVNSAGLITGWLVRPGSYQVKVTASDSLGGTGSASFSWTVKAAAASGTAGTVRQAGRRQRQVPGRPIGQDGE